MEKYFRNIKYFILNALIFLFPLFFITTTQEFFITNKFYLLTLGALLLILVSSFQLLVSKRLVWQKSSFDNLLILFLVAISVSIVIISPNKIQALLNPNFGLVAILSLIILYFYLSRSSINLESKIYNLGSIIVSILTIIFFLNPLKNVNLPQSLQFLKNAGFTPFGNRLDLAIFLGFFVTLGLGKIIGQEKKSFFSIFVWFVNFAALFLTFFALVRPTANLQLPPFKLSWFAAVETLKNPLTAFFGVGVDNFSAIFTRIKDLLYNQSINWQIGSFSVSRSALLHIFTETGVLGLVTFGLLLFSLLKSVIKQSNNITIKFVIFYLLFVILFFPPSLITWFLLFISIAQLSNYELRITNYQPQSFDFSNLMPVYLGFSIFSFIIIALGGYFLGRSYLAEAVFKKSIDGYLANNGKIAYDNQRQAIIFNPYIERFRINFSQTNLLIANNIAGKTTESAKLTEQDRQTITQGIQAAINEAKAAVALNPQKAVNWENLAVIYRNIITVAQGADLWTISAYQRAVVADPQNPSYRLGLGGVYYSLGNWDEAGKLFEQAVSLKPNWPNAYYNLAWASYQKKDYQKAVNALENALKLIDPVTDKADYDKAKKELDEFKTKLPKEEEGVVQQTEEQPSQLALPTPVPTTGQPKIELPEDASPEAK